MKIVLILAAASVASALALTACRSGTHSHESGERSASSAADPRLDWWREARFGLFVHWGLYAIPAGAWRERTDHGEWVRDTAQIPVERYEELRARWNPVKFDADAWARAARDAGMKYVVITSKHHDGFGLFDSRETDWDVMSTPDPRDILQAVAQAFRGQGLVPCWYHSIMDWHHPDYLPRRGWEKDRPAAGADFDRYERYLHAQVTELLTRYGPIGVMWFDGEWESTWNHARGQRLYDLCRRLQPDVIVNNRVDVGRSGMAGMSTTAGTCGDFGTPEQEVPATGLPGVDWESCMTMNSHWGFNARDKDFKSVRELVRTLVDVASKGGNFLLNVGPTAEGEIPAVCLERLQGIGKWMRVNGDAIYGTQASPVGAPAWGRVTQKYLGRDTRLFLHVFDWPKDGRLVLDGLGNRVKRARLMADPDRDLVVEAGAGSPAGSVRLSVPDVPADPDVTVVEVLIEGAPLVFAPPAFEAPSDIFVHPVEVRLRPSSAGIDVRYTRDGSEPTAASPRAVGPIRVSETTTITARSFHGVQPVAASVAREFVRVTPEPALQPQGLIPGLVYLTTLGDRTTVDDPRGISVTITGDADLARIQEQLQERTALTLGLPEEYRSREHVMLTFLGYVRVPADDVYQLALTSDDGSVLRIGERFVLDNDGLHGSREVRGTVPLAAGWHRLGLDWFNRTGGAVLELTMGRLGEPLTPIPAADLAHDELSLESVPATSK